MKLHDRKFLVIGGTGGIGRAVVDQLRERGAQVVVTRRKPSATVDDPAQEVLLDLESPELEAQLAGISRCHPDIDSVVHCAGQNRFASVADTDAQTIDHQLAVNLRGPMLVARHFLSKFSGTKRGLMVFVGSTFGSIGFPGYTAYCASKFGLRGFTEALRRECADAPVSILYVAPRATATAMNPGVVEDMNRALGNHVDDPRKVALQIVGAIQKDAVRQYLGWPEKLFVVINSLLPRIVDRAMRKQLPTIQQFLRGGAAS